MSFVTVGEICEFKYGKSLPAQSRTEGSFNVYGSNGVVGQHDDAITTGQTVIVGRKGSIGEVNYSETACWPIDTTYYIDNTATAQNIRWLSYALRGLNLGSLNKATGVPGLNRNDAYEKTLYLPPLDEQKRIAAILDQADSLRRLRQRSLDRLNTLSQAIFYEMFGGDEHDYISLSDYFEEVRMGPFGSLLHKADYVEGGIPLINPMHIIGGEIAPDPNFSISPSKAAELENYRLRPGDLIIGRRGEMGRCAVVSDEHNGFLCGTGSMLLRAARDKTAPLFLAELIRSKKVVERIEAVASGVTMMNLNSKSFDRVMVPDISVLQQHEYFRRAGEITNLKPEIERSLSNLDTLFASLQHRAFRGEL